MCRTWMKRVFIQSFVIINGPPITKASTDPKSLEALTPNHLLLLRTSPSLPPGEFEREDVYARRRWKQVQSISNLFWNRWVKEYFPQLQECQKWSGIRRNFIPGGIVLLVDDKAIIFVFKFQYSILACQLSHLR